LHLCTDNASPAQLDGEIYHLSSLPSPPATSPMAHSPLPSLDSNHASISSFPRTPDTAESPLQSGDYPHDRTSSPGQKAHTGFDYPSTPANKPSAFEAPITPQPKSTSSHPNDCQTPTFTSLSSPVDSPCMPPLPTSPSFNSLVADAVGATGGHDGDIVHTGSPSRTGERDQFQCLSQDTQNSHSSSGSQEIVNQQLTQGMDVDADADSDAIGEVDYDHVMTTSTDSISLANENESSVSSYPPGQGGAETDPSAAELVWSSDQGRGAKTSPSISIDEASSESQSQVQSQFKTPQSTPRSQFRLQFEAPLPSPPIPQHARVQRQAWYQAPLPLLRAKSLGHPKSPIVKSPTVNGNRSGSSSRSQPQLNRRCSNELRSQSEVGVLSGSPNQKVQNRGQAPTHSSSRNIFRSGSLQISPTELKVGRVGELLTPCFAAKGTGSTDESMVAYDEVQRSQSSQSHSQSSQFSSNTSQGSNTPAFSYLQLQTQAPYQSQSLSQI